MMILTFYLIGDAVAAFLGKALSEMPLGAMQPGGNPPFSNQLDPGNAFSAFGRSGMRNTGRPRGPRGMGAQPRGRR